eukprot:4579192-Prymnesium_polylepis.1
MHSSAPSSMRRGTELDDADCIQQPASAAAHPLGKRLTVAWSARASAPTLLSVKLAAYRYRGW